MMKKIITSLFLFSLLSMMRVSFAIPAGEHVLWQRAPISVVLPIGQEKMVTVQGAQQLTFFVDRQQLPLSTLKVLSNGDTLYLTAQHAFKPVMTYAVSDTGKIVMLNLSANAKDRNTPLTILPAVSQFEASNKKAQAPLSQTALMRYGIQHLFSPARIWQSGTQLQRVTLDTKKALPLLQASPVIALPRQEWEDGTRYVTAILLRNPTPHAIPLNASQLCGQFGAVSFYPRAILTPHNTLWDSSAVFVVTDKPFVKAIQACTMGGKHVS